MVKLPPAISVECVKKLIEKGNAGAHFALAGFLREQPCAKWVMLTNLILVTGIPVANT